MAYIINGKVFTEHALLDEMVYNLDIIMDGIEIKNEDLALQYETEESLESSDIYMLIKNDLITFETFPFTAELLIAYGYDSIFASQCEVDPTLIPEDEREDVLSYVCNKYVEDYVEKNNYYRTLLGLPWYNTDEDCPEERYFIYLTEDDISEESLWASFDFNIPIHEYTNYQIALLKTLGVLDELFEEKTSGTAIKYYKYIKYLGDAKLDLYEIRQAADWDIMYMPSVETLVSDRFKQLYAINRTLYQRRFHSEAYKLSSDYYEQFMIILLLCETYNDMIAEVPEWYIRRDIFDLRSCQYFLESQGVEYFKEIPLKYQIRIVKNLNKLIRYKSTNKNIWDIIDIFAVSDVTVYKYYMFKKAIIDSTNGYTGEYELEFVRTPIGESYDDYIKDLINIYQYDDITLQDKWWDGQNTHEYVYQQHLAKDFTIEGTKFISIEDAISMSDYVYQTEYFLGLLADSNLDTSDIAINIPEIDNTITFTLSDIFILLNCLTAAYDEYNMLIRLPEDNRTGEKPEFTPYDDFDGGTPSVADDEYELDANGAEEDATPYCKMPVNGGLDPDYTEVNQETFYNWLSWNYPYLWTDLYHRVNGFNMNADLDELAELISFNHSSFFFSRGWTLEELGVDGFMTSKSISSIEELMEIYDNNTEIHDQLLEKINQCNSRDEKIVFQFVYDYLFTKEYDTTQYTLMSNGRIATDYVELLQDRNYILYEYYLKCIEETDRETRQDVIRQAMNNIVSTLEYYLNYNNLNYVFSTFTVSSFQSILRYIYLMINFFRSFKVYFLEMYVTYIADDKNENSQRQNDQMGQISPVYLKAERDPARDNEGVTMESELYLEDYNRVNRTGEVLDVFGHYEGDPEFDMNIDGGDVTSIDEETDPRDINAAFPEFTSYIPYMMVNGGREGASLALWDMNGAGPGDQFHYCNIDGKTVEPEVEKHYIEAFGYNVDGGRPDWNMFTTPTMIVRVHDNQIKADVKLRSVYYDEYRNNEELENPLEIRDDGLYLKDIWASAEDINTLKDSIDELLEYYKSMYDSTMETLEGMSSYDLVNNRVSSLVDKYFEQAIINYNDLVGNLLLRTKAYTDTKVQELYSTFNTWITQTSVFSFGPF